MVFSRSFFLALTAVALLICSIEVRAAETTTKKPPSAEQVRGDKPLAGLRIGVDSGNGAEVPLSITNYKKIDAFTRVAEANVNRQVESALTAELSRMGAEVVSLTNSSAAVNPVQRLGKGLGMNLDLILSVHHSYSDYSAHNLTVAYYHPAENKGAEVIARRVNEALSIALGLPKTGAIPAPKLLVEGEAEVPVALIV